MLAKFAALLWELFGDACPLYDKVLKLWRVLNHPSLKAVKSKFTHGRCAQITCQVTEETRMFFGQCLGPNDFTNKGPRGFPTANLGFLVEDVQRNKLLDSITMSRQWITQDHGNNWYTHHYKGQGASIQANGEFSGDVPMPRVPYPYPMPSVNTTGSQTPKGGGWKAPSPEHFHPVFIKFMARFLQKYATHFFAKVLIAGNKTVRGFPKFGGNIQVKRDMCMHYILAKYMNPNFAIYHAQAQEMDAQYAANIFTVLAPGMDYISRHGVSEIQVTSPVGSKRKREG